MRRARNAAGRALAAAGLLVGAILVAPSAAGAATPSAADLGIEVEVGFGQEAGTTGWNLVQVTASPPVPLSGVLEVRSTGMLGVSTADQPLEVAAGATRVIHLLLPPAQELTIAYVGSDGERVRIRDGFVEGERFARLGVLGEEPSLPTPLNTMGTDRPIRGVSVDPAILALGPRALDALDALLIGTVDLAALSPTEHRNLEVAVANGLELLVHVRSGDGPLALAWNPVARVVGDGSSVRIDPTDDAWRLTATQLGLTGEDPVAASVRAGNGKVTAVVATPGDGGLGDTRELWASLVQLRARPGQALQSLDHGGELGSMLFGSGPRLPSPLPFALFALAFVALVGPVNGFVLRRLGRRELAWVTVPVITAMFTVGALGAAVARPPVDVPVVRAAWWMDGVGQELTVTNVQSPARGTTEVSFPGARDGIAGGRWSRIPSTFERADDATTVRIRLETLQLASIVTWGDPGRAAPLEIDATVDEGRLLVTVTNIGDGAIDDVEVVFATSTQKVGTIASGQTVDVAMDDLGDQLARPRNVGMGMDMGMGMMGRGGPNLPESPGPGRARELLTWNQLSGSPGTVWVTGSTSSDLGLAVPRVAGNLDDRGTFVAVGTTARHLGGDVLPHEVTRDVLHTNNWSGWQPSPLEFEGEETVLRYRFPGPELGGELRSTLDVGMNLDERGMGFEDPWREGCFEVVRIDGEGNEQEAEEVCGHDIGCPPDARECSGSETTITACFADGSCQVAERIGGLDGADEDAGPIGASGLEVFDHATSEWLPIEHAFDGHRAARDGLVSALGDVLVRARGSGYIDLGQRGLGVTIGGGA